MKLTKGRISQLMKKNKQTRRRYKKHPSKRRTVEKTFRRKRPVNLANMSLKRLLKQFGGDEPRVDVGAPGTTIPQDQTVNPEQKDQTTTDQTVAVPEQQVAAQDPTAVPEQPVAAPDQTVAVPEQQVAAQDPNAVPEQPVAGQDQTVAAAEQPVAAPDQTVVASEQPVAAPDQTVAAPEQPVAAPEQPVVPETAPEDDPECNYKPKEPLQSQTPTEEAPQVQSTTENADSSGTDKPSRLSRFSSFLKSSAEKASTGLSNLKEQIKSRASSPTPPQMSAPQQISSPQQMSSSPQMSAPPQMSGPMTNTDSLTTAVTTLIQPFANSVANMVVQKLASQNILQNTNNAISSTVDEQMLSSAETLSKR